MSQPIVEILVPGAQGPTGTQGAVGPAGDPGPQGDPGPTGERGPEGSQGDIGPQGPPGDPGADGNPGPQGLPGKDGKDGVNGTNGADGERGPQGLQGAPGVDGTDGGPGPQGEIGPEGPPGEDGADAELPEGWSWDGTALTRGTPGIDGHASIGASGVTGRRSGEYELSGRRVSGERWSVGPLNDEGHGAGIHLRAGNGGSLNLNQFAIFSQDGGFGRAVNFPQGESETVLPIEGVYGNPHILATREWVDSTRPTPSFGGTQIITDGVPVTLSTVNAWEVPVGSPVEVSLPASTPGSEYTIHIESGFQRLYWPPGTVIYGSTGEDSTWLTLIRGASNWTVLVPSAAPGGFDFEGTGRPPVSLNTEPVGTTYRDRAATDGAMEWTKVRGSGSASSWQVTNGDTGWQAMPDMSTITAAPVESVIPLNGGSVSARRINNTIYLQIGAGGPGSETATSVNFSVTGLNAPGWRPHPISGSNYPVYAGSPLGFGAVQLSQQGGGFTFSRPDSAPVFPGAGISVTGVFSTLAGALGGQADWPTL